jgi:S-adenosylmethionine uptake transporter
MIPRDELRPFITAFAGVATYSLMDALMKGASLAVGAYSAMAVRSVIGFALALPLWRLAGWRRPNRPALRLHAVRGVVGTGMALTFFHGLTLLPMAEAITLSFIAPLIALYLAVIVLGERIGCQTVWASLLGLAGVIVIAANRIGHGAAEDRALWGIASILFSAVLFAWNLILQRQQALVAKPFEVASFQNGIVGAILLLFTPWFLTWPDTEALGWITGAAVLAVLSAALMSWAYARAEAQVLVPLEYSAFLWAALLGWLVFAEPLTVPTVAGAALIIAACWIAAPRKHTEQSQV